MKKFIILIAFIIILGGGYYFYQNQAEEKVDIIESEDVLEMMVEKSVSNDEMVKEMNNEIMMEINNIDFTYSGKLIDVSGEQASGNAQASFFEDNYQLLAEFNNLPIPEGTDFYEGWIVRKQPFHFISTGKITNQDGMDFNIYFSGQDLTDHDFYVLTIEPDDGNPAPADHILEGTMEKLPPSGW